MQLVEYRRSDESDLVEAVFADAEEGNYLHIQKLGARRAAREGGRPRIQYAEHEQRPPIGVAATDYAVLTEGRNGAWLEIDSRWHELMSMALGRSGLNSVVVRFAL
jgi:hypothetical protein